MRVRIAALADFASLAVGGKLNVLGVFGIIYAERVPATHVQMYFVAQLEFESSEAGGTKDIRVVLIDEDGQEIFAYQVQADIERHPQGTPTEISIILNLHNTILSKYGNYDFRLEIDGQDEEVFAPLRVLPLSAMSPTQR